jgi:A/G-specific adenine glycosylase
MSSDKIIIFQKNMLKWASKNLRKFPWRKNNPSRYQIFIAEILLKRTTGKAVSSVYEKFLKEFPNIKKLSESDEKSLREILSPIGYSKRAEEIKRATKFIIENFNSKIPKEQNKLLEIPFIGNYTSNAILSLSCDKPYPMVDSNVNRILYRVFFGKNSTTNINREVMQLAYKILPSEQHRIFNLAMIDLGGTICLPRNPKCNICPLQMICKFKKIVSTKKKK